MMRQAHVLLMVENVSLARDHRLQKQVGALAAGGYRVSVICRDDPENQKYSEARVHGYRAPADATSKLGFLREYSYSWLMAAWLTVKVFLSDPFDAIQISGTPDIYFVIGAPFKLLGRRLLLDQRDLSPELYAVRYGRRSGIVYRALCRLERMSYRAADQVITVNRSLERIVHARGGLPSGKVTVVGNGPRLARTNQRPPRTELKQGKRFLCCWLGLMGPQDRLDVALRAIDHLVHVIGRSDCHFAFIGDGESRGASEKLAAELGLGEWTSFPGWAAQEQAFAYLSTADFGIEPNLEEIVSPVKGMEYMAFGRPFVAFDLEETRVLAAESASYARPGDVAGFARLIDRLLDDPERREEMGRIGRRLFEERLAWERQQSAYLEIYERLLRRTDALGRADAA
jgi:glycosyltransferase involved in cell wall biosynthesis